MSPRGDAHPLRDGNPPAWATSWGQDDHGVWCGFDIEQVDYRMRWIGPGAFMMGSPEDEPWRGEDEGPQHRVTISSGFWLGETPVTQALWSAAGLENTSRFRTPERPVENVSWVDVQDFLQEAEARHPGLALRLPTEAEWEYACRAGTKAATYAGPIEILGLTNAPILDPIAWYGGNCGVDFDLEDGADATWEEKAHAFDKAGTRIVGLKRPNPWGLRDMLGNVFEWCADSPREYDSDPAEPFHAGFRRVIRGGSWLSYAGRVRAGYRYTMSPRDRRDFVGFRLARGR